MNLDVYLKFLFLIFLCGKEILKKYRKIVLLYLFLETEKCIMKITYIRMYKYFIFIFSMC